MSHIKIKKTWIVAGLAVLLAAGLVVFTWTRDREPISSANHKVATDIPVKSRGNSIELSPKVVKLGGIKTVAASEPTRPRQLELRGDLAIDPGRLVHVHSRFQGQIVEIAMVDDNPVRSPGMPVQRRPLRFMDHVSKGQRLAVLWSKDLGEKKSELVDAQAKLGVDEVSLKRLKEYSASISEKTLRDAEKAVDLSMIAVNRAELTLRSWAVSNDEIAAIKAEAELIHKRQTSGEQQAETWARVEIIAPIDGTIVEKNVTLGDMIDTTSDLFKIADLSVLNCNFHIYEDDLVYLYRLNWPIQAEIRLPANPDLGVIEGTIQHLSDIVDANEHMAMLFGAVDNSAGRLLAGQFVSASIDIGNESNVVEIPTTALVDDDEDSYVFIQPDPEVPRFLCRKVQVVRRHRDVVYIRGHVSDAARKQGIDDLDVGELVVSRGALELRADMLQRQNVGGEL